MVETNFQSRRMLDWHSDAQAELPSKQGMTEGVLQGCLYGGASEDGPLGDAWLFDGERGAWEQTANSGFGGFPGAAKAWHAAAVLEYTEVPSVELLDLPDLPLHRPPSSGFFAVLLGHDGRNCMSLNFRHDTP